MFHRVSKKIKHTNYHSFESGAADSIKQCRFSAIAYTRTLLLLLNLHLVRVMPKQTIHLFSGTGADGGGGVCVLL